MIDKEKGYVTYDDVRMKLHGGFVIHKGAIYVATADVKQSPGGNNHTVNLALPQERHRYFAGKPTLIPVDYRSEDVDISSIPLGYVNKDGEAHLVERHPFRKNAQTVSTSNVSVWPHERTTDILYSKEIQSLVTGEYPSFEDALSLLGTGEADSVAFSRLYAIVKNDGVTIVRQRKRDIGYCSGGRVTLYDLPDRSFIIKQLMKLGVPV